MSNLGLAIFTTSLEFVFNNLHPSKISSVFITLKISAVSPEFIIVFLLNIIIINKKPIWRSNRKIKSE